MASTQQPTDDPITPEDVASSMGVENYRVSPVLTGDAAAQTDAEKSVGRSAKRNGFSATVKGTPSKQSRAIYLEYASGAYTLQQIADTWGMSVWQIKKRVDRVNEWTKRNWQKELGPIRSSQDMELQELKTLALQAYQRSTQPKKTRRRISGIAAGENGGAFTRNEVTVEESVGDARFLAVALNALSQRSSLWGLNAPKKTAMTNVAGDGPMQVEVLHKKLEQASDATLRALRAANRALHNIEMKSDAIDAEFTHKDMGNADQNTDAGTSHDPVREGAGSGDDSGGDRMDESPDATAIGQSELVDQ